MGMPAPMMQPLQMPQMTAANYPPPAGAPGVVPSTSAVPRGFCKYWLPEQVFATKQDIKELIAGPGGAHFMHVLKKYPAVELKIDGQCSTAAPPAHRLHVCMSSEDSEVFEYAATDVLDLVETVCDMVGEELGMNEDEAERLTRLIRAEKYFEANGARTPLPPSRSRQPEVVAQQSQAAPPPIVDSSRTAHGVAPSPSFPQPGKHEARHVMPRTLQKSWIQQWRWYAMSMREGLIDEKRAKSERSLTETPKPLEWSAPPRTCACEVK